MDASKAGNILLLSESQKALMLITLWITQRENAYVEIDQWHCNSKKGNRS
jgi:hypothetical protein